ncbi:MAG: BTAD domain-containing putative transcriptional regulator [Actinobacteria bacterium]|nr:BTAD domain-containing putative transcriptional regulator [Actinomycetota bacterium]
MDFRILGPLEVEGDDGPIQVRGRMEKALLALLVVNAGAVVSVDVIAEELWGDHPPPTAIKTVRSYVSRLRRRLGKAVNIETTGTGYALNANRATIDVSRFEDLLYSGIEHRRGGSHELAASELASALDEWRGPALAGLEDHNFARIEAARLDSRRLEALEARLACDLELGRHRQLVAELEQLVSAHPHHEAFWKHLMMALYRSDRQADALGAFRDAKASLGDELGIEPSEELRELEEQILLQDPALLSPEREDRVHNLPTSLDSFVGRDTELNEIRILLTDYRCVTLTGVGGSGKTRLGIEAARSIVDGYPDGARWTELATINDPDGLAEHILLTFGEPGSHAADPGGVLVEILRPKRFLLILDNCEHMIGPVAELTDRLLTECPDLWVLATSREALGIAGEAVYHVPTLEVPEWGDSPDQVRGTEAALLLAERVRAHIHDFTVDEQTASFVTTICRKLDGIPLALELGAARMRTMTIGELADGIDNRFELLTKGNRTAPPRQQTLRATIEWSYELLTPAARRTFRALGVFVGPWTLKAARAVTLEDETEFTTVGLVDELVDKCLVETTPAGRFRLLETMRQFAFEQLVVGGEAPTIGRRHRDWYRETAIRENPELRGSQQVSAWTRLEQDHDNLRAAIQWSLDNGDTDGALELVAALGYFWMVRGYWSEAWRWLERALAAQGGSPLARAEAITAEAITEVIRVNFGTVKELLGEALVVFEEANVPSSHARASLLHAVGEYQSEFGAANELLQKVYDSSVASDDSWSAAFVARYLGEIGSDVDDISLLEESYQRFMRLGDRWNAAFSMYFISGWYLSSEMYMESEESAWKARDLAADIGDIIWHAHATRNLGLAAFQTGDHDRARKYMSEALERLSAIGDDACSSTLNRNLAALALESGDTAEAIRLIAEAIRSAIRLGSPMTGSITLWRAAEIAVAVGDAQHAVRLAAVAHRELDGKTQALGPMINNDIEAIESQIVDSIEPGLRDEIAGEVGDLPLDETLELALQWCDMQMTSAGAGSD